MIRGKIERLIEKAIKNLQQKRVLLDFDIPEIEIKYPQIKNYGDYSTNIAMRVAKLAKKGPIEVAELIVKNLESRIKNQEFFEKIKIAKPGFINFFLSESYLQKQVSEILKEKEKFGSLKMGKNKKIQVEFISANPTGPLTLGNGRGGFCGDVLANVLTKAGYQVEREYYINDMGEQVRKLGHSVIGDSKAVYKGEYINELRKKVKGNDAKKVGEKAGQIILEKLIKPSIRKMVIKFDVWFSEKSLHDSSQVDKVLSFLKKKKLVYQKEGALWFKSTKFGDDKDRVLIRENGEKTYFASDIAYFKNKFKRGFKKIIYFWGADHYGYVNRMKAVVEALGYKREQADFIIMQLVRLFQKGKEVRMAKRTGTYVTIDELINEVGLDVARFFFLTRGPESHLIFDLDLAKEKSEKNPVYYIQYAFARICSILRKLEFKDRKSKIIFKGLNLLKEPAELNLIKQLIRFPEVIEDTVKDYQVQRIPQYSIDLATSFHRFYKDCKVLTKDREIMRARVSLVKATKIILKNTLDLMGISSPEKM